MRYYTDWDKVPLLLDTSQAAILLQITPEHLSRLCRKGIVPAMQLGKEWRISRDVIREMAMGRGNQSASTNARHTEDGRE